MIEFAWAVVKWGLIIGGLIVIVKFVIGIINDYRDIREYFRGEDID